MSIGYKDHGALIASRFNIIDSLPQGPVLYAGLGPHEVLIRPCVILLLQFHYHHQILPSDTLLLSTPFNSVSNYSPLCLTYALLALPSPPLSLLLPSPSRLSLPSPSLDYPPLLLSYPL